MDNNQEFVISEYGQKARDNFLKGYNCSQAIVLAFSDVINKYVTMEESVLLKMASPFGGGMGRLREVCGSVTGMFMVLGFIEGYYKPKDDDGKTALYKDVQYLAEEFRKINGSIICREILGLGKGKDEPVPEKRTEAYYAKRPCPDKIASAGTILEKFLQEKEIIDDI